MGTGARYGLLACLTAVLALGLIWDRLHPPRPVALASRGDARPRDTVRILIGGAPVPVPDYGGERDSGAQPGPDPREGTAPDPLSREAIPPGPSRMAAVVHAVVPGDTLGGIALKHLGTSRRAAELAAFNGLRIDATLRVGQELRLPPVSGAKEAPPPSPVAGTAAKTPEPAPPSPRQEATSSRRHTVVAGDNLSRIARKYYGSPTGVSTLCSANGIRPTDILRPGQVLLVP